MYVKCGDLVRAQRVFDRFPFKDVVMWNSMIMGYSQHRLGQEASNVFHDMCSSGVPQDDVTFIGVLSACSYSGKVKEGLELFESMKCRNNKSHPEQPTIMKVLQKLYGLLREAGYHPDCSFVLHDVNEEEKTHSLGYHSEKLALAYGLLKVPEGMPISVMKNLRVCGDCYPAIKLIAKDHWKGDHFEGC